MWQKPLNYELARDNESTAEGSTATDESEDDQWEEQIDDILQTPFPGQDFPTLMGENVGVKDLAKIDKRVSWGTKHVNVTQCKVPCNCTAFSPF